MMWQSPLRERHPATFRRQGLLDALRIMVCGRPAFLELLGDLTGQCLRAGRQGNFVERMSASHVVIVRERRSASSPA